jgi:hypothetical protein
MIRKLNTFFETQGKILTEKEYKAHVGVPYRLVTIQKFLGGWPRLVNYLETYYPKWKGQAPEMPEEVNFPERPETPEINLEALGKENTDED